MLSAEDQTPVPSSSIGPVVAIAALAGAAYMFFKVTRKRRRRH